MRPADYNTVKASIDAGKILYRLEMHLSRPVMNGEASRGSRPVVGECMPDGTLRIPPEGDAMLVWEPGADLHIRSFGMQEVNDWYVFNDKGPYDSMRRAFWRRLATGTVLGMTLIVALGGIISAVAKKRKRFTPYDVFEGVIGNIQGEDTKETKTIQKFVRLDVLENQLFERAARIAKIRSKSRIRQLKIRAMNEFHKEYQLLLDDLTQIYNTRGRE